MRKKMDSTGPSLNLEAIKVFFPGWRGKGQYAETFAHSVLKPHFATLDTLKRLILLEDGIEAYVKEHGKEPSREDKEKIRELLGLGSAIGSA